MNFTISATAPSKAEANQQLQDQREPVETHRSLKNQLIEHLQSEVDKAPDNAESFSISLSAYIGYAVPAPAAS